MAKKKEEETEDHMLKLAEREEGRLKQDISTMLKELSDLKEKENICEVRDFKAVFTPDTSTPDEQLVSEYKWIHVALTTVLSPIQDSCRRRLSRSLQLTDRRTDGQTPPIIL